ncbi:FAD-binding oxidoreductase [Pseudonocardia sp. WMMC193]|uniref:FAD-binding oxidoreductase n=1 Tax=Pseudonocardia sp. WMMC193 TaxID=2911965 RepID=UPI001F1D37FD|nr:FAD-binding oxidoreductase [Pseudonocardia sp. WMMC193]MCF7549809.1 FAD-binding oxidoreductase [Pseudonocardia sp. WMMC193]
MTTLPVPTTPLDALAADLRGPLHRPGDPGYAALAVPWNLAAWNPAAGPVAVVEALDETDVATAVRCAAAHGLQVAVQHTGHGATAASPGTLLVHTGRMTGLVVDGARVRAGAGVRWTDVLAATPEPLAGLTGSAPAVGVVGYLTGGGHGPLARTFGVASDLVTAFEVVTGDGRVRRAAATENPALYWGLRGGKGALGIVTAVEFDLVRLPGLLAGCLWFDGADAAAVLHTWREWCAGLPEEATTSVAIVRLPPGAGPLGGRVGVAVRYAWVGAPAAGRTVLDRAGFPEPVLGGVGPLPYAEIGSVHADPVDPMPVAEASTLLRALPAAAVDALLAAAGPEQIVVEIRQLGGALSRAPEPSAVCHRDAAYCVSAIGVAQGPGDDPAGCRSVIAALAPWSTGGRLPNFAVSADPAEVARAYDPPTLARLSTLVATFDPHGVIAAAAPVRAAVLQDR